MLSVQSLDTRVDLYAELIYVTCWIQKQQFPFHQDFMQMSNATALLAIDTFIN